MKKILLVLVLLSLSLPAFSKILVGSVNIQQILVTVQEGTKVRDKLKKSFESKQAILKKEEEKIRKAQEDYKKQALVMNDKAKMKKEQELQKMIMDLQQKSMGYQKEIQEMEQKLKAPILDKIKEVVDEVSKEAGVDLTFEVSTAAVVYAKSQKDLTDEVIKLYDKRHPAK